MEFNHPNSHSIKSLVKLATLGFYPLFNPNWIEEVGARKKKLTGNEKVKAKKLFTRLIKHKGIERKKTVIIAMKKDEREILVRAFLSMVEGKILDQGPELH